MALTNGPKLGLLVNGAAGEEHYDELIAQWRGLDVLIQANVIDKDLTAPPGAPANGDTYIVGAAATGDWATHDDKIAAYSTVLAAWEFYTPQAGWRAFVVDEAIDYQYSGSAWAKQSHLETLVIECVPEATVLVAGHLRTFHMPANFTLTEVLAGVATPQATGAALQFDLKEAGTTVFSTKVTILNTESDSTGAADPVISDASLAKAAKMTVIADTVGDGTAKGLTLYLTGYRT